MKNNGEQKITKIYCSYPLRFLMAAVLFFICFNAYAQETMKFDSEAKKLELIRQALKKEKYLRPSEYNATHCKQIMKDLLANKNFKAIEPVVRADSVDDPRMAKWKHCEENELPRNPLSFESLDLLGAPPYRWYKIELDGNKENGPEDMIYHNKCEGEASIRFCMISKNGYTWVDLNNCEIKNGFTVTGALEKRHSHPDAIFLSTLVYYKGELWAADFIGGFSFSLSRWLDREREETCQWWLYKPKETVK